MGARCQELTIEQLDAVIGDVEQGGAGNWCWMALLAVLSTSGARISESVSLVWPDLIDKDGKLRKVFSREKLKTRRENDRISAEIAEVFELFITRWHEYCKEKGRIGPLRHVFALGIANKAIHRRSAWRFFKDAFIRLGFKPRPGYTFALHSFRKTLALHSFQAWLEYYENKKDRMAYIKALRQVQKMLGHKSIDTTIRYLNLDLEDPYQMINSIYDKSVFGKYQTKLSSDISGIHREQNHAKIHNKLKKNSKKRRVKTKNIGVKS